jgi:hypothetical protein
VRFDRNTRLAVALLAATLWAAAPRSAAAGDPPPAATTPTAPACHGQGRVADGDGGSDEYFVPTMTCALKCRGGSEESVTVTRIFRPRDHGLRPGDGSDGQGAPWGGFTATLEAWSRFTCLEAASQACGSLARVEYANLTRITSGTWTVDQRVLCPTRRQARAIARNNRDPRAVLPDFAPVLSPFQAGSGAVRTGSPTDSEPPALPLPELGAVLTGPPADPTLRSVDTYEYWQQRAVALGEVPDSATTPRQIRRHLLAASGVATTAEYVTKMQKDNRIPPPSPCRHVLRGRACFGDCLVYPENRPMVQYLATNEIGLENVGELAVCGDNLADFFATHDLSRAAQDTYCEKFVTDSLVLGRSRAITCSSYRLRVDCSTLD